MTGVGELVASVVLWAAIPVLIGLLLGLDRLITARLQGRKGPSVTQPLRDLYKLLRKQGGRVHASQAAFALLSLVLQAVAALLLVTGGDALAALLISGAGSFVMVLGAFAVPSPYSHLGAHREMVQILTIEPVLLFAVLALGYVNGSFLASEMGDLMVAALPLAPVAMVPAFLIRLEKSPYDIATAHSEVVAGPYIEYSGRALGITKLAHWFELAVLFGILLLFFNQPDPLVDGAVKVAVVVAMVLATALIDNVTARSTRWGMLKLALPFGIALVALNLAVVHLIEGGMI
ncbi:NADH-quinone oxidoreductase subunit H [Methanomassiliicoccus luminyensis]|uniref:NADH-quinone oxidoreductase subunit H n=1 Tax=Methanomassiliicoccus luminyensis TaxID=1080712 RepID=UPI000378E325|nr:NADH-quinone oxidoreductase subunit H [Methanomassiliicoccus luminyensis]